MSDFGAKLRQAREARGISLRTIAQRTKISVAALEALERNDVSKLPGGIFSRGFVKSYATEVGLNPEATVEEFLARFAPAPPPEPVQRSAIPERQFNPSTQRATAMGARALLGLLVVGGVAAFFLWRGRDGPTSAPTTALPTSPAAQATAPAPVVSAPGPAPPETRLAAGTVRLEIHPTAPCWVKLVVDGETVVARLMQPGERQAATMRDRAVIDVGDAGAFAYSIDGRPGRPLGATGQVRTARITRETVRQYVR